MGKKFLLVFLAVVVGAGVGYFFGFDHGYEKAVAVVAAIDSFQKCKAAGYPIMESYPEQCKTPDGRNFVNDEAVFCTQDAKLCPDGSYVGRIAPDCEFAACPLE